MMNPKKYMYVVAAVMLLVAKEDIDGLRVRDRIEMLIDKELIL